MTPAEADRYFAMLLGRDAWDHAGPARRLELAARAVGQQRESLEVMERALAALEGSSSGESR